MYERRVKVFIGLCLAVLLICLLRLAQMQLGADDALPGEIAGLMEARSLSKQFQTLRGKILDRQGEILAADMPQFQICLNYRLSCFRDDRVTGAKRAAARTENTSLSAPEIRQEKEIADKQQDLEQLIDQCRLFGLSRRQMEERIQTLNNAVWNLRSFYCWARGSPDPNVIAKYKDLNHVPLSEALASLARQYPDPAVRNQRIAEVTDIPEMSQDLPLVELKSEDEVFAAQQLECLDTEDVQILPTGRRYYPYRRTAAQTIGWVGPATQSRDLQAFAGDPLASYLKGEVCGREDGVEYACEGLLRGRRGEVVYDIDRQLVRQTDTELGQDVQLTLDIRLQERIEQRLTDPKVNPAYARAAMAGAIIDVRSGDVLALVSLPSYDLNSIRQDYNKLLADPNRPMTNRALCRLYPPGSVAKPVVLIAGLESGVITPEDSISCPAAEPPTGWPKCLIYRESKTGHDQMWVNKARNAVKGSCNVYFSHLADRVDGRVLQEWFFRFGYGRELPLSCPASLSVGSIPRGLRQAPGEIGSTLAAGAADANSVDQLPRLLDRDRKMFGIGQGNFRVTPLQVANAFATLARRGRYLPPRLFLSPPSAPATEPVDLPISHATLDVVYDGMSAVVNERGGSAYHVFAGSGLTQQGVTVYGKTGSTERPYHAWFAGFAADREGAKIAFAVVVEGGQRGGGDAGPLACEILKLCVEAGYVGHAATGAK
ncbi:MAG: penicillin-binding transpeptidase domain-containing protein [Planctomycetes bacterium]|nr:penicillin-binding transpeptidase domain-containing protein [Planctomycetota bacterium]